MGVPQEDREGMEAAARVTGPMLQCNPQLAFHRVLAGTRWQGRVEKP